MALIYFAHPIDFADEECNRQVQEIRQSLAACRGIAVFDPAASWIVTLPLQAEVQQTNDKVLRASDCVVAYLPTTTKTKGTIHEIAIALERGIPVVVITDSKFGEHSIYETHLMAHNGVHQFNVSEIDVATLIASQHAQTGVDRRAVAKYTGGGDQLTRAHDGDAGFDLAYNGTEDMVIAAGQRAAVPTGVRIELPLTHYALIVGRSSSFSKRDLLVPMSVIDQGFRGELFAVCWNFGHQDQRIKSGERVAQLLPMMLEADLLQWVNSPLSESERGDNGFGSSGR